MPSQGRGELLFPVADHFGFYRAGIDAFESLFHCASQKRDVRNLAQMFGNEPNRLLRRHPMAAIETREIYRTGIAPKRTLEAEIEVDVKVTHGQLAKGAVNRFAISTTGEVRFRHSTPGSAHFEDCDHMIGVAICFQIEDQRWKTESAQRGRGKDSTFQTRRGAILQNFARRSRIILEIVRQIIEEPLNSGRRFESA